MSPLFQINASFFAFRDDLSFGYAYKQSTPLASLYQTHDGGKTWKFKRYFSTNTSGENLKMRGMKIMENGNLLMLENTKICLLDTASLVLDTIYKINENNFQPVNEAFRSAHMHFINKDTGVVLAHNIFRTINGGATWDRVSNVFAQFHSNFHFVDNKNVFFTGLTENETYKLFYSADGGMTWDTIGSQLIGIRGLQFVSVDTGFYGSMDSGCIYKTTNRGQTWEKWYCLNDGKTPAPITSIAFVTNKIGWITIKDRLTPFKTVDGGKTFFSQELPKPTPTFLSDVKIIAPNLMFLTGSLLYRSTNQGGSPLLSVQENEFARSEEIGSVVYPNPTNSSFKIKLESTSTKATVEVFDLTGRCVITNQPFLPNQDIDISYLQSGTYLVKIGGTGNFESRLLVKE
ncbi:T9SS type A sorting domain-containing protein [Oscillatoria amoena NRMC-F 0135]|nr:T9SS type A sorting domain-containing protein [Oscillatoria amoena NRMC-F 0135]